MSKATGPDKTKTQPKKVVAEKNLSPLLHRPNYNDFWAALITIASAWFCLAMLIDITVHAFIPSIEDRSEGILTTASVTLSESESASDARQLSVLDPDYDRKFWENVGLPQDENVPRTPGYTNLPEPEEFVPNVDGPEEFIPNVDGPEEFLPTTEKPKTTIVTEAPAETAVVSTNSSESHPGYKAVKYDSGYQSLLLEENQFVFSEEAIEKLDAAMKKYSNYQISFGITSLDTSEVVLEYKPNRSVGGASTVKVAFSWYVLTDCICTKTHTHTKDCITLDTVYTYNPNKDAYTPEKNSPLREQAKVSKNFTLKQILWYTLYYSDDDGYKMLYNRFPMDGFNKKMKSIGSSTALINGLKYGNATVYDRTLEWTYIYTYCNSGTPEADFMSDALNNTSYAFWYDGTGIPAHHKSGWSGTNGVCHDTGVFHSEYGDYIFVILTDNTASNKYSKEVMSGFSETLYDVFTEYGEYVS
jgi:hypothetical protein